MKLRLGRVEGGFYGDPRRGLGQLQGPSRGGLLAPPHPWHWGWKERST